MPAAVFLWEHTQLPQLVIRNMKIFHCITTYNNFADDMFTWQSQFGNWWVTFSLPTPNPFNLETYFQSFHWNILYFFPSKILKQNVSPGVKVTQNQLRSVVLSNLVSFWHWSASTCIASMWHDQNFSQPCILAQKWCGFLIPILHKDKCWLAEFPEGREYQVLNHKSFSVKSFTSALLLKKKYLWFADGHQR